MLGQQALERGEPLRNPLAVVQPVDADGESASLEAAPQPLGLARVGRLRRLRLDDVGIEPDRKGARLNRLAKCPDMRVAQDLASGLPLDIVAEGAQVRLRLEADEVVVRTAPASMARGPAGR